MEGAPQQVCERLCTAVADWFDDVVDAEVAPQECGCFVEQVAVELFVLNCARLVEAEAAAFEQRQRLA